MEIIQSGAEIEKKADGSRTNGGLIGAGGVIRDDSGSWIAGFKRNIGKGEVLQAEAWGLFSGLQMAIACQIKKVMVESDSAVLINLLHSTEADLHPLGTIISNCKILLQSFDHYTINHIHRERNMVADFLAKTSTDQDLGICFFFTPPDFIIQAVLDDIAGVARPRSIVTALAD